MSKNEGIWNGRSYEEEGEGLYANDVIDVVFMDADDEEYADQPEYTHQLFEDEKIDFFMSHGPMSRTKAQLKDSSQRW